MNILFVSLEESGKKISNKILTDLSFENTNHVFYTFGLDGNFSSDIQEINNIKLKPLMGFFEVIKNFRYIFNLRNSLINQVKSHKINYIFFIDSFDFSKFFYNKYNKVKCSQIVGPSVFIWNKNKANYINQNFDKLFSIFLADKNYYNSNVYSYIGHPLSSHIVPKSSKLNKIKNIGIFLGSRDQEVFKNIIIIFRFINICSSKFKFFFFTLPKYKNLINSYLTKNNSEASIILNDKNYYYNLSKLDFALACSGTVHLELSLSRIPHLIFYKTNFLNAVLFKIFVKSNFISLLNIFSSKEIVKEFIQNNFNEISINSYINSINYESKLNDLSNDLQNNIIINNINHFDIRPIIDYLKKFS